MYLRRLKTSKPKIQKPWKTIKKNLCHTSHVPTQANSTTPNDNHKTQTHPQHPQHKHAFTRKTFMDSICLHFCNHKCLLGWFHRCQLYSGQATYRWNLCVLPKRVPFRWFRSLLSMSCGLLQRCSWWYVQCCVQGLSPWILW